MCCISDSSALTTALTAWKAATPDQQTKWATDYVDALGKAPDGDPAKVAEADYGPVPVMSASFLGLARTGGLEGILTSAGNFYGGDQTESLLLLTDGAYLEDLARAQNLGGDQWGLMMLLTLALVLVPFIPGLRSIPRRIPIHRLIWRAYYRSADRP